MNITFKNIIAMAFVTCALRTECTRRIFVNLLNERVTFRAVYKDGKFCLFKPSNCSDDYPLGPRGAWRADFGSKNLSYVTIYAGKEFFVINDPSAYGIFAQRDPQGKLVGEVYGEEATKRKGFEWKDWDTGKR